MNRKKKQQHPPAPRKPTCFQRTADQMVLDVLRGIAQSRYQKLKQYQMSTPGKIQTNLPREGGMHRPPKGRGRNNMAKPEYEMEAQVDEQQDFYHPMPDWHQTLQALTGEMNDRLKALEREVENIEFINLRRRPLDYMTKCKKDLNLHYQIGTQRKRFDDFNKYTKVEEFLEFFVPEIPKYDQFKDKMRIFQQANEILEIVKEERKPRLAALKQSANSIEQNYFNYIKTQLMIVALEERLPRHNNLNYDKFDMQWVNPKESQRLSSNTVASLYRTMFSQKTFSGLQDGNWVHNSVIDNYIEYLKYTQGYNDPSRSKCAIYSFAQSQRFQYSDTYRFSSGPIFTQYERVGMVINVKDQHWFFIGVFPQQGKLVVYDSIPKRSDNYTLYLQRIRKFVKREQRQFNSQKEIILNQLDDQTTPKQPNGYDCGIHVLWNLTYFLESKIDKEFRIQFNVGMNKEVRIGMYHFMAYLLSLAREQNPMPKYDWLQFCSRSLMLKANENGRMHDYKN